MTDDYRVLPKGRILDGRRRPLTEWVSTRKVDPYRVSVTKRLHPYIFEPV